MKKLVCLLLCLAMTLSCVSALAFNYQQRFDNEATFETLEEARENAPVYLSEAMGKAYVADPDSCIQCGLCEKMCPDYAIYFCKDGEKDEYEQ